MDKMNKMTPSHSDMMIKVCGMKEPQNIAEVAALAPMLMGFIFHEPSPRDASDLSPDIISALPDFVRPVAVTVDKAQDEILDICGKYGFKIVQLHGSETPAICRKLKDKGLVVFKAIGVDNDIDWAEWKDYEGCVDMFIMDKKSPIHGGTGQKYDWSVLDRYNLSVPYLLSGGIGPDDIDNIIAAMRPGMAGIDINSRFETSPGIKDLHRLINFILSLRKFNEHEPNRIPFWEKTK